MPAVKAFYVKYSDTPVDANVKSWNVTVLDVGHSGVIADVMLIL